MTELPTIHRRDNGTIDLDFYHAGATALRRQAMRDASRPRAALGIAMVVTSMLGVAAITASAPGRELSGLQRDAETLQRRISALSGVDADAWQQFYGRAHPSRQTLIVELQRQLTETQGSIERVRARIARRAAASTSGAARSE
jgi:hypothetical protein